MSVFKSVLAILLLAANIAVAQDRPDENALFGESEKRSPAGENATETETSKEAFASGDVVENPLQIGGIFYQQMVISSYQDVRFKNTPLFFPLQVDGYMDARPNDRLRAFIRSRLLYDVTRDPFSNSTSKSSVVSIPTVQTHLLGTTTPLPNNPQMVIDQAWLKFDMNRNLFVTVGKQHLRWGPSHTWNPTDFLHTQQRDPLQPIDPRLGRTMVKFELPWEKTESNFYAVMLLDNPIPASTLGQMGGAFRAETLLDNTAVGAEMIARGGLKPAYGADISTPLGPFDAYAEAAFVFGATHYQISSDVIPGQDIASLYTASSMTGPAVQASGGLNYTFAWKENRAATFGLEYFHNQLGYDSATAYPVLIFLEQYRPFYVSEKYASLYITAEGPDAGQRTSYTFSTLSNLSDASFISRLDFSLRALTYLSFGSFVAVHYGTQGGEFNFSLNTPDLKYQGTSIPSMNIPSQVFDLGISLRMSL